MNLNIFLSILLLSFLCTIKAVPIENDNIDIGTCECIPFGDCPWASKVFNLIQRGFGGGLTTTFRINICDLKKQHVWCCENSEGTSVYPTSELLPVLKAQQEAGKKAAAPAEIAPEGKESGRWKPIGFEGECGLKITLEHIVGGKIAKLGEYPYMALLGYNVNGDTLYACGGSLINKKYVLTAAHCFDQLDVAEVVLGENEVGPDPDCPRKRGPGGGGDCFPKKITRKVEKIIKHEDYKSVNGGPVNDIALIRLAEPVPLYSEDPTLSAASPVCLPWDSEDPGRELLDGDKTVVTGWGRTTNRNAAANAKFSRDKVFSTKLQYVQVPVANEKCSDFGIDENLQICAGGKDGEDSCSGDSGGPLAYREFAGEPWYQVGLVSYGTTDCGVGKPGVYTKITGYLDWIDSKLES